MKLIIAGSRDLSVTTEQIVDALRLTDWTVSEVVSGGAPGVDASGERFASAFMVTDGCRVFPADWSKHGKAAGPLRNEAMARYADAALIFCKGQPTPGSSNMAAWMLGLGKPVQLVLL